MSMWHELLTVKTFREGQAESALRQQRAAWQQAQQSHQSALSHLQQLRHDGHVRELAQYRELCTRLVHPSDIEALHQDIAYQRAREQTQQNQVAQALHRENEAALQLRQARVAYQDAVRQKNKFLDLAQQHTTERLRASERLEDLELEEVANTASERDEWNTPEQEEL